MAVVGVGRLGAFGGNVATVGLAGFGTFGGKVATSVLARSDFRAALDVPGEPPHAVVPALPVEPPPSTWSDLGFAVSLDGGPLAEFSLLPSDDDPPGAALARIAFLALIGRRRAEPADELPDPWGDPPDRGGWWGDTVADHAGDRWGSRLWLLYRARGDDVPQRAEEYVREALAFLVEDGIASSVDCEATPDGERLDMAVSITRPAPGGNTVRLRFDLWKGV